MGSGLLHPEEWPDLVTAIRDTKNSDVGQRISARESRFDNFFSSFDYVPLLYQTSGTALACSTAAGKVFRIGGLVFIHAQFIITGAGAGPNIISFSLPETLPAFATTGAGQAAGGTWDYTVGATGVHNLGSPSLLAPIAGAGWRCGGIVSGQTSAYGFTPNYAVASGDILKAAIFYPCALSALL